MFAAFLCPDMICPRCGHGLSCHTGEWRVVRHSIHAPNLGWYEGQDPGVVLERGFVDALAAKDYMPPEVEAMLAERVKLIRSNAA